MKKKQLPKQNKIFTFPKSLTSVSLIGFLLLATMGFSQTPAYYNSSAGNSSNTFPLANTTNRVQWLYDANIFRTGGTTGTAASSGMISKVYFRLGSSASSSTSYSNYTISLGQTVGTTSTWTSTTWATGLTQCFTQSTFSMSGATANSWYSITLQTPFSYDPAKSLIFELKVSSTSGSNYVSQVSSGGSKRIWGTYSSGSGTSYGSGLVDFGFELLRGSNDAGIAAVKVPLCAPTLFATVANFGINAIDSVKINWSINGTPQNQNKYTTRIASGGTPVIISLSPDYNFVDGNTYTAKVWTSLPNNKNDTLNKNDTMSITFKYLGPAGTPTTYDAIKCGPGKAPLKATTPFQTDSVLWYDAATGGQVVAKGKNTLSPPLVLGVNNFYAQSFKISPNKKFENSLFGNYTYYTTGQAAQGGFADLTPKVDMFLDSFRIRLYYNNPGSTYSIYMRTGSYVPYYSSATGWTQIVNNAPSSLTTIGGYYIATLKVPELMLSNGITYGFYIVSTGTNPVWTFGYNSAGNTSSNAELNIFTQHYFYGSAPFSGVFPQGYTINLEANYRTAVCPSSRVSVNVTVKPSPNGAGFVKGTPFQTTQPNTLGVPSNPDIVAKNDTITYELTPPTGYINSNYGITGTGGWITVGPTVKTKKGTDIPAGSIWSWSTPNSGAPGIFKFTAPSALTDSFLIVSLQIKDLGPYYCDSTILRHIFVAPRPVPDFNFNQPVCDGDAVLFNDASTISTGVLSYKWDFGTGVAGDTSTINTTVFKFPTFGTYYVKLITTSQPYGYSESITYPVVVTEIPKIDFKVLNACEKVAVTFKNNTTIGAGTITYDWDFGDPTTTLDKSTAKDPSWTYSTPNAYKVRLRASASGCAIEMTKNANQFSTPKAKFSYPSLICDKSDVQFTNLSTIALGNMGYTWTFGDGGVSNFANPVHQYSTFSNKTVKMKAVSEFGCVDSMVKTIAMFEAPNADFTWGPACNLSSTSFSFTGTKPAGALTNFTWNFAGEGVSMVENPQRLFSVVGRKMVTLTLISNNGCSDVISKEVNVKLQSKADFEAEDVCEDNFAVFTNKSQVSQGNLLYLWKFGDAAGSTFQSPRHLYIINKVSQTFNVTLVAVVPGGCSDSISKQVTVNAKPISDFTYKTSGRQVNFTPNQPGNTLYQWRFGDGGNSTASNPQYNYLSFPTGKYFACLSVVNAAGCTSESCQLIEITGGFEKLTKLTGVKVYPNPNRGNITVTVEEPKSDISISIFNLLGEIVKTIETNPLKTIYSVELNVANGVYLVKVTNGGLISTQKITINK